jgi:hypothetical protein
LAKRALSGAIDGMSGRIDYTAIDLTLRSFGVGEGDERYCQFFSGVFYYLASYRSSMFTSQPAGTKKSINPGDKILGLGKR